MPKKFSQKHQQGAALVELATILPFLIVVISGLIYLAQSFNQLGYVEQLSYNAVVHGARQPVGTRKDLMQRRVNEMKADIDQSNHQLKAEHGSNYPSTTTESSDRTVAVTLRYNFNKLGSAPFAPSVSQGFIGPVLTPSNLLSSDATQFANANQYYDCNGLPTSSPPSSCGGNVHVITGDTNINFGDGDSSNHQPNHCGQGIFGC